ncbi:MAG: S8 family peptidase [Candidatus Falkowbacteria bacterium]
MLKKIVSFAAILSLFMSSIASQALAAPVSGDYPNTRPAPTAPVVVNKEAPVLKPSASGQKMMFVPGSLIVKYRKTGPNAVNVRALPDKMPPANAIRPNSALLSDQTAMKVNNFAVKYKLNVRDNFKTLNTVVYNFDPSLQTTDSLIASIKSDPTVEYVERDYVNRFDYPSTNDAAISNTYNLDNSGNFYDSQGLHSTLTGADTSAAKAWTVAGNSEGQGVLVAVIDTGVAYNHPDLAVNMWDGSQVCKDRNGVVVNGGCPNHGFSYYFRSLGDNRYSSTEDNNPAANKYMPILEMIYGPVPANIIAAKSHGTHISGIIAAGKGNNVGIAGIAPQAKIMALQIDGSSYNELKAINFAINNGVKIINASYGQDSFSQADYDAIKAFGGSGGLFIASAGNNSRNNDSTAQYPCNYNLNNVICVAATDYNDGLAYYSNWGATSVDVAAPGSMIYSSAIKDLDDNGQKEGYMYMSGTSMATPAVVGVAALIWGSKPNLTNLQVKEVLLSTVDKLGSLSGKVVSGGRVNAYRALQLINAEVNKCGNGVLDNGEVCDGSLLNGQTCQTQGYQSGALGCASDCLSFNKNDCVSNTCGDGVKNGSEECDRTDLGNATCQNMGFAGGTLGCSSNCTLIMSSCTKINNSVCGDGIKNGSEECDRTDLGGASCVSKGFAGGTLGCSSNCTLNTASCIRSNAVCGDGIKNGTEQCDRADLGGATCQSSGFAGGTLKCTSYCVLDVGQCVPISNPVCGDGIRNGTEECDRTDFGGINCVSRGFTGGTLSCSPACIMSTANCTRVNNPVCGDGIKNGNEECDRTDLGGATCQSKGFDEGSLSCSSNCSLSTNACSKRIVTTPQGISCVAQLNKIGYLNYLNLTLNDSLMALAGNADDATNANKLGLVIEAVMKQYGVNGQVPKVNQPLLGNCTFMADDSGQQCYVYSFKKDEFGNNLGKVSVTANPLCSDVATQKANMMDALKAGKCCNDGVACGVPLTKYPYLTGFSAADTLESIASDVNKQKSLIDQVFHEFGGGNADVPNTYTDNVGLCRMVRHYYGSYCYVYSRLPKYEKKVSEYTDAICGNPYDTNDDMQSLGDYSNNNQKARMLKALQANQCCIAKTAAAGKQVAGVKVTSDTGNHAVQIEKADAGSFSFMANAMQLVSSLKSVTSQVMSVKIKSLLNLFE